MRALWALVLMAGAAGAQELTVEPLPGPDWQSPLTIEPLDVPETENLVVESAGKALLRVLDKVSGKLTDLTIAAGETVTEGRIEVSLSDCRFPSEDPSSDAFAHVTVRNAGVAAPVFDGWMIASSPALNALDHPRYDVWVLRCINS